MFINLFYAGTAYSFLKKGAQKSARIFKDTQGFACLNPPFFLSLCPRSIIDLSTPRIFLSPLFYPKEEKRSNLESNGVAAFET